MNTAQPANTPPAVPHPPPENEAPSPLRSTATIERITIDVSGQDWLPQQSLDGATITELELVEDQLHSQFQRPNERFVYIGRNRFELLSTSEAQLIRAERHIDHERMAAVRASAAPVTLDPALANCVLLAGPGSQHLGQKIAERLGIKAGGLLVGQFANGETRIAIGDSVRDRDVFVIQSGSMPVNDSVMELYLTADALRRASARSVTAVTPYFTYSRQDRKDKSRAPISARAIANLYEVAGVDRVVTIDIHAEQIEGFFNIPMDNLSGFPLMVPHICERYADNKITIVSPDTGGMKRAEQAGQFLAKYLTRYTDGAPELDVAIRVEGMYKKRDKPNEVSESRLIGDGESVREATCILLDDMVDTGGSSIRAAQILRDAGAKHVVICATHALFSRKCVDVFRNTKTTNGQRVVDEVLVTDTLPLRRGKGDLITVISVETLLAEAIRRICQGSGASLRDLLGFTGKFDH